MGYFWNVWILLNDIEYILLSELHIIKQNKSISNWSAVIDDIIHAAAVTRCFHKISPKFDKNHFFYKKIVVVILAWWCRKSPSFL